MSAAVIPVKRTASRRRDRLKAAGRKPAPVPLRPTLPKLRDAVKECRACPLWERATQAVFGEGVSTARVMFVGEQPGFDEDLAGKPFVGPSGKLLDKAREQANIPRAEVLSVFKLIVYFCASRVSGGVAAGTRPYGARS